MSIKNKLRLSGAFIIGAIIFSITVYYCMCGDIYA